MSRARPTAAWIARVALVALLATGCATAESETRSESQAGARSGAPRQHLPAQGALGPYSAAVLENGWCFLSGKIAAPEARGGSFRAEAESALDGVEAELARAGLSLADAVSVTVYLTDMAHYAELNEVYAARLPAPYPARATVAVTALPAGARVELVVIARRR